MEHLRTLARELPHLPPQERTDAVDRVLGFLRDTLLPHARAEEAVLYPEWAALVGAPDAAAPMVHDHEAIAERIDRLAATGREDVETLQELLYELHALILVHFGKEEDLQLPAFDAHPEVAARVLERMGEHAGHAHAHQQRRPVQGVST
ncbi:MAG: hemerythrin domain-containing protein [Solirubrobacterales bacterium]|nr:hemerythrin domain-containing protein [Solirubrobacterales bacterium]